MKTKTFILSSFCLFCSLLFSTTYHIKQDGTGSFTTIQDGIDASTDSDTVLVYPGTYYENINYNGKNITVASLELTTGDPQYIYQTIIDGQRLTSCVSLISEETDTCLRGLTITNGQGEIVHPKLGGGISIWGDSDLLVQCDIINCVIMNNFSMNAAGIYINDGLVLLSGNSIRNNFALKFGGGLAIRDHSQVIFDADNRCSIYDNWAGSSIEMYVETIHFNDIDVIVDTFTVAEPESYFAQAFPASNNFTYNFDILNSIVEPVDNDMYVSPFGDDDNTGLSINDPLKTINLAVRNIASNAENPHTVHLATGTYNQSDNQQSFAIGCKAFVNIIGEDMNTTIIDGESNNVPFFITGSNYSNSTIKNITFQNSEFHQSLIMTYYSDSIKYENIIIQNSTIIRGAGINNAGGGGNFQLDNVTVDNINVLDGPTAGGWFNETTSLKATNCTFSNNSCIGDTGSSAGLYAMSSGDITIQNCKFFGNSTTSTTWLGYASTLALVPYNDFIGNSYIHNNLFFDNENIGGRSTIYARSMPYTKIDFFNNTLIDNVSDFGCDFEGRIYCRNNIMRNIGDYEIALFDDPDITSYLYCSNNNILGGEEAIYNENNANLVFWEEGNIDEDPLFLLSGDDPYQLSEFSPCIDAGIPDTTGLFIPPWDLLNNHRVWDGDGNGVAIIDMGCYEYDAEPYVGISNNQLPMANTQMTNYPNPFNPETTISFNLSESGKVKLEIYNIKGQKVKTLMDCTTSTGKYELIWKGKDDNDKRVSSGIYFYQLITPSKTITRRMLLLK